MIMVRSENVKHCVGDGRKSCVLIGHPEVRGILLSEESEVRSQKLGVGSPKLEKEIFCLISHPEVRGNLLSQMLDFRSEYIQSTIVYLP